MESDPETTGVVNEWESRVKKLVDRPSAEALTDLSQRGMMFIAEAAFLESTGADYSQSDRFVPRWTDPWKNTDAGKEKTPSTLES